MLFLKNCTLPSFWPNIWPYTLRPGPNKSEDESTQNTEHSPRCSLGADGRGTESSERVCSANANLLLKSTHAPKTSLPEFVFAIVVLKVFFSSDAITSFLL